MVGIYKITNTETGEIYIGQSKNLAKRKYEHWHNNNSYSSTLDKDIFKEPDKFTFEVLEECPIDKLTERETFYIKKYSSDMMSYNTAIGGNIRPGSANSNSKLKTFDIINIRNAYANHENKKEVYERYKDLVSWRGFEKVWSGITWQHVKMDVYTEENKYFYTHDAKSVPQDTIFSDEEVMELRKRYINESGREIYNSIGGKERCSYSALESALIGKTHSDIPVYSKKLGKWIDKNL